MTNQKINKVCVIGLGYVGLPTAAIIARAGLVVAGYDKDRTTIDIINKGKIHIIEPELENLVQESVSMGKLYATHSIEPADVFIIAVPTPFKDNNAPNLEHLEDSVKALASVLSPGNLIILESTSPVGTTRQISDWLRDSRPDLKFPDPAKNYESKDHNIFIAHSPERVLPGQIINELVNNDRVIGGLSTACSERAEIFYSIFVNGKCYLTNAQTAELVKLAENAFRDTNIAFANEISLVCDKLNIDVWEMIDLANLHPRVEILRPGPGVGGHCIAVDPWFIVHSAPDQTPLIQTSRRVNNEKPNWVVQRAIKLTQPTHVIACLGLSYKSNIDDLRESPAVYIVEQLAASHPGPILVAEPNITKLPNNLKAYKNIDYCPYEKAINQANTILVLTDHTDFKGIEPSELENKNIIDTRGIWQNTRKF